MSEKIIPEYIDPYRYAEQSLQLSGLVKMANMQRLSAILSSSEGQVAADLQFGRDEQKIVYLKGRLETELSLQCQRCMEPFVYDIISDFALGVVHTLDEANALPDHYEPVLVVEGQLALRELIEDEIILNLPIIPRHEPEDCKVSLPIADAGSRDEEKGENPFHVLKSLKHK